MEWSTMISASEMLLESVRDWISVRECWAQGLEKFMSWNLQDNCVMISAMAICELTSFILYKEIWKTD